MNKIKDWIFEIGVLAGLAWECVVLFFVALFAKVLPASVISWVLGWHARRVLERYKKCILYGIGSKPYDYRIRKQADE